MKEKADLVQREVDKPINGWCASGHCAPEMFKRQGADSPPEPTRFFLVKGHGIDAIYCEPCLIVANYIKMQQKKGLVK